MKELITIQSKLNAPKSQYNSFGKYKYRSCEDILAAVKPLLQETSCTLTISDDILMVGNRIYVKATCVLTNAAGEKETTTAFAREEETKKGMDGSQVTGASSSYARKYALNGMFAIDDNQDSDVTNNGQKGEQKGESGIPKDLTAKIAAAKSRDELMTLYSQNPQLHDNTEFKNMMNQKFKTLPQ